MEEINIQDFLNHELVNYASYDNLRKIGSCIDGLKNAARKVMFTIHEKKIKDKIKVSQLSAKCAEYSDYLHGDNLWNVVVTLGKDYAGTNNIPLIKKFGNFGTRCINESSAPRYIFARGSDEFFNLFKYEDDDILEQQYFEGNRIEPRFYVPSLPIILVNGSEGVSSGFAQKILSRNPESLKEYIETYLKNGDVDEETADELLWPYIEGFEGDFWHDEEEPSKWWYSGVLEHIKNREFLVKEIPFTFDLKSYISVLETLEEKEIITKWTNESDGENKLQFRVWFHKGIDLEDEDNLYNELKLIKCITENYTCINEENKISEFETAKEIIDHYIGVKLQYLQKRKDHILKTMADDIEVLKSKIRFLTLYIEKKIEINNVPLDKINKQLDKLKFLKINDSYSYLLGMPIYSLTKDKLDTLKKELSDVESNYKKLSKTSIENIWINDLNS